MAVVIAAAVFAGVATLSPVGQSNSIPDRTRGLEREADELVARFRAKGDENLRIPLVRAQIAAGRHSAALALAEQAQPSREISLLQGEALLQMARTTEARSLAAQILEKQPDDGAAALLAGRAAFANGDFESALAMGLAALRGSGVDAAAAWLFRARIALFANDLQAAGSALQRAGEAGASELDILPLDVERRLRGGDLSGARAALGDQYGDNGASYDPRIQTARALLALAGDDPASAARSFEKLEAVSRADPLLRLWHAYARARAGDSARAAHLFASARSDFPLNPIIALGYGEYLISDSRLEEARAVAQGFGSESPLAARLSLQAALAASETDEIVALVTEAACDQSLPEIGDVLLGASGELIDSRANARQRFCGLRGLIFDKRGELSPGLTKVSAAERVLVGRIALADGDDAAAASEFAAARAGDPAAFTAVAGEIRVLVRGGNAAEAIRTAAAFVTEHPDALYPRIHLAALAEAAGDREGAVAALSPVEKEVLNHPVLGGYYVSALESVGDYSALARAGAFLRRERPADLLTVRALEAAGRLDHAADAARLAVVADPANGAAAAIYRRVMASRGRGEVAREFLASIGAREGSDAAIVGESSKISANAPIAKDLFEKARYEFLVDPTNGGAALTYAKALERAGKQKEAARVEREAAVWNAFSNAAEGS